MGLGEGSLLKTLDPRWLQGCCSVLHRSSSGLNVRLLVFGGHSDGLCILASAFAADPESKAAPMEGFGAMHS